MDLLHLGQVRSFHSFESGCGVSEFEQVCLMHVFEDRVLTSRRVHGQILGSRKLVFAVLNVEEDCAREEHDLCVLLLFFFSVKSIFQA